MSDADLLIYFFLNDYVPFFEEQKHRRSELWALAIRDHFKHLKPYALNGDVRNFIHSMSSITTGYFPEIDTLFPHWWER